MKRPDKVTMWRYFLHGLGTDFKNRYLLAQRSSAKAGQYCRLTKGRAALRCVSSWNWDRPWEGEERFSNRSFQG